jgi:hypothetical protein
MKELLELIKSTPNDMELGKKVRQLYNENKLVFFEMDVDDEYYKSSLISELENPSV